MPRGTYDYQPNYQFKEPHQTLETDVKPKVSNDENGNTLVDFTDPEDQEEEFDPDSIDHGANLAEYLEDDELNRLASELTSFFDADYESSDDWRNAIEKGLQLLGLKIDEVAEPFEGACGAHWPLIQEAMIQFQARAIAELLPSDGPVKTRIMGAVTDQKEMQAQRVREFMNYQITDLMEEYFDETDRLLLFVAVIGSGFKKTYYDPTLGRPISQMIPPQDFVISYDTTDHRTSGRYTHVIRLSHNDLLKRIDAGLYRDINVPASGFDTRDNVKEEIDRIEGREPTFHVDDDRHTLLEMHVDCHLDKFPDLDHDDEPTGIARPYIVTIDQDSNQVLAITRNWAEGDALQKKLQWFTHYRYLPGLNFYGIGLINQLANLQMSITASLRVMIDAGQFNTLPAGFKARGVKFQNADIPIAFGEWRDVDGYGDDITKAIIPLPTKEPSQALGQMMQAMIDAGRRLAAIGDLDIAADKENVPVGSVMALLEQQLRVMSSIHKRLHKAQHEEFKILFRINKEYLPEIYPFDVEGGTREIMRDDFNNDVDVVPVSDPNVFSETQRIMKSQSLLQLAQQFPQAHNLHEALRRMYQTLNVHNIDALLTPDTGPPSLDVVSEHMNFLHNRPNMAYAEQDHDAHIAAHKALLQDPEIGQSPIGPQLMPAVLAHIADHMAHKIRLQVQAALGEPMPPPPAYSSVNQNLPQQSTLPPELENEVSRLQSMAIQQIGQLKMQAAQGAQLMAQQQQAQAGGQAQGGMPPAVQQAMAQSEQMKAQADMMNAQTKQQDVIMKHATAMQKLKQENNNDSIRAQLEQRKMLLDNEQTMLEMEIAAMQAHQQLNQDDLDAKIKAEQPQDQVGVPTDGTQATSQDVNPADSGIRSSEPGSQAGTSLPGQPSPAQ